MNAYNYERFDLYVESGEDERDFETFPNILHAGERAPDGELSLLDDGSRVRLSELWRRRARAEEIWAERIRARRASP